MRISISTTLIFLAILSITLSGALGASPGKDITPKVVLVDIGSDNPFTGQLVGTDGKLIKLSINRESGQAVISLPVATITRIQVLEPKNLEEAIKAAALAQLDELTKVWNFWKPLIGIPGSPASALGDRLAALLVQSGNIQKAAELYEVLANTRSDPSLAREARVRGIEVRFDLLDDAGKEQLAQKLISEEMDPRLLCSAHYVLAQIASKQYEDFLIENPRWRDDPPALKAHDELYQQILDGYLYAVALHAALKDYASRGLMAAAKFHLAEGEKEAAADDARLLLKMYPSASEASDAKKLLSDMNLPDQTTPSKKTTK